MSALPLEAAVLRPKWVQKITVVRVDDCTIPGDCWLWLGYTDPRTGYGRVQVDGTCGYVHRVMYERNVGPIPEGLQLDHLCRQRNCCAPHHLEPVTPLVNAQRGKGNGSKTHCPQGHEYTPENSYLHRDKNGYERRACRECRREYMPRYRAMRRAQREATWAKYQQAVA